MRTVQIDSWSSDVGELMSSGEFSRDAKWAAFASTRSGQSEIWVKPILGGDAVQVSKNGYYNQYPIWSENGQELAFLSIRKESYGIWRAVFTGGQEVQIVGNLDPTARPVYWTPGGKIYFQERGELCVVDVASGQREQTTNFASRGIKARMIEISRDERSIVYSAKEDDDWKLRVMRLDAGTSEVIATSKDQIDYFAWRPGGDAIIFSGFADGTYQLFEAVPGRADPLQLSNGNEDFFALDISTDGKILYGSATESSDLWSVEVRGGKRSLVANDIAAEYWADISPDGSSIAFQSVPRAGTPFGGSIIVSSAGNPPIKVSSMASLPKWSPDGQWIAFLRKQETGTRELWKVRPSGDDATKLADGNVMATGATYMPYLKINTNTVTWSPDGTVVAYSTRPDGDKSNIWIVNADGSQKTQLTKNEEPTEIYYCPTWSPDGGLLVFMSERRAGTPPYRLWLYQSGNEEQRVIFESKEPFRLLGFVDGGSDVLISQNSPTAGQSNGPVSTDISTVSLQTGLRTKVNDLSNAYPYNLHLSPDGTSIAFVSRRDGQSVLLTVPIRGGVERELLVEDDPKILFSSLAWSPDGHRIVFGGQTRTSLISMLTK